MSVQSGHEDLATRLERMVCTAPRAHCASPPGTSANCSCTHLMAAAEALRRKHSVTLTWVERLTGRLLR